MRAGGLSMATASLSMIQPPPGASTIFPRSLSSSVSFRSSSRKPPSPRSPKIWAMGMPSRRSISASKSRYVRVSFWARRPPTVDFPATGRPTRMMCGLLGSSAETVCELRKVAVIVVSSLAHRIAAELLKHGFGEHNRKHRLRYDAHGWYGGNIAALSGGLRRLPRRNIDGGEWLHQSADRLHRHAHDNGFTGGHAAFESPRPIGSAANAARERAFG